MRDVPLSDGIRCRTRGAGRRRSSSNGGDVRCLMGNAGSSDGRRSGGGGCRSGGGVEDLTGVVVGHAERKMVDGWIGRWMAEGRCS